MTNISETLDNKFSEAFTLSFDTQEPIVMQDESSAGLLYETIGLDSEQGGAYRYVAKRGSLDTETVEIVANILGNTRDISVTHQLFIVPRTLGDGRKFEELPRDAFAGSVLWIDGEANEAIELYPGMAFPRMLGAVALDSIASSLVDLRVAKAPVGLL